MALKAGYRAVPGTARRVERIATGEVLSHRQYRNLDARAAGWRNLAEAESDQAWKGWTHKVRSNRRSADVTRGSRLARDYVRVKRERERRPPVRVGSTAGGRPIYRPNPALEPVGAELKATPLGRLLAAAGVADAEATWQEGGS